MKVSLITATYNSENTLVDCLRSARIQDYQNLEHVVIDGNSSDRTLEILKEEANVNDSLSMISEPDQGIYDALNKGIEMASGDIIGFLHSDDILASSDTISKVVDSFTNGSFDGVYGDLIYVSREQGNRIVRNWRSKTFKLNNIEKGWMPAHPTFFLRRDVYRKHGKFNLKYKISADYDFMLRVLRDHELSFNYLPKVLVHMRTGGASNKSLSNLIQKSKEDYQAMRDHDFRFPLWSLILKNFSKIGQFLGK